MTKKRVLGVIGLGHVGAHVAYSLAVQGIADELVLVDQNAQKVASEAQDLRDSAAYLPHRVTVREGDFAYVVPPEIAADEDALGLFEETMRRDQEVYDQLVEILSNKKTKQLIAEGMSEKAARSAASKLASPLLQYKRSFLPAYSSACSHSVSLGIFMLPLIFP